MDQILINWIIGAAGFLVSWMMKILWDALRGLRSDLRQIERDLSQTYVQKDEFREVVREMRLSLREGFNKMDRALIMIFNKLESKEDKE